MRHSATRALFERRDVLIVASVSCIYGLGSPEAYHGMMLLLDRGAKIERDAALRKLVEIQYERTTADLRRGAFRVRGDTLEIWPSYAEDALRVEFWGNEIESIRRLDPVRGKATESFERQPIYPNSHYVTPRETLLRAIGAIRAELEEHVPALEREGKLLEAQRLGQRTAFDLEMLEQVGYCHGIENYSRHLTGREPGVAPPTLMDYFPDDTLLVMDESHVSVPQVRGMYRGDRSRKETLVDFGFRLPSAMDNRPLKFEEFDARRGQTIYVSATPGEYELELAGGEVVEQLVRPTGLVDPAVVLRPVEGQVDDLLGEIRKRVEAGQRTLVTTLTKRMAEDLTEYYRELGVRVEYLHGLAGGDPRRRQGGLPAFHQLPDPDDRARGAAYRGPGDSLRRRDHRVHATGHRRDRATADPAAGVQRAARHHAGQRGTRAGRDLDDAACRRLFLGAVARRVR